MHIILVYIVLAVYTLADKCYDILYRFVNELSTHPTAIGLYTHCGVSFLSK